MTRRNKIFAIAQMKNFYFTSAAAARSKQLFGMPNSIVPIDLPIWLLLYAFLTRALPE
jgi:hypothetical protein